MRAALDRSIMLVLSSRSRRWLHTCCRYKQARQTRMWTKLQLPCWLLWRNDQSYSASTVAKDVCNSLCSSVNVLDVLCQDTNRLARTARQPKRKRYNLGIQATHDARDLQVEDSILAVRRIAKAALEPCDEQRPRS